MADQSSPIHVLHISKAGGTALKHALEPVARDHGILLHRHQVRLEDVPLGEKVVFFVRHPLGRFTSGFLSRQRQGRPRYYFPWREQERTVFARYSSANSLAEAIGSARVSEKEDATWAMRQVPQLSHTLSFWFQDEGYLWSRRQDILFIGLQERMNADFSRLANLLRLPASVSLPTDEFAAHKSPASADRALSVIGAANLMGWYAQDCKLYEKCAGLSDALSD